MWRIFRVRIRIRIGKLLKSAAVGRSAHETLARTDQNCLLQGGVRVGPDSLRARTGNACANGQDRSAHGRESEQLARTDGTTCAHGRDSEPLVRTDGIACAPAHGWEPLATGRSPGGTRRRRRRRRRRAVAAYGAHLDPDRYSRASWAPDCPVAYHNRVARFCNQCAGTAGFWKYVLHSGDPEGPGSPRIPSKGRSPVP